MFCSRIVAPFAGAWIEIRIACQRLAFGKVAPFAGAWIEIYKRNKRKSLTKVAPFAGAWIEIVDRCACPRAYQVAPFAGAWIEIELIKSNDTKALSLPSRERGLKYHQQHFFVLALGRRSLRGSVD